jgi:hypothetical protein
VLRRRLRFIVPGALLVALAGALVAGPATGKNGGSPLEAVLIGANEVPGPGDPDATGTAELRLNSGKGRICYEITWADVEGTVTAAHIHKAPAGSAAGVFQDLFVRKSFSGTGTDSGCVFTTRARVKEIRKNPSAFYVNVHSSPNFGPGAIRGQLTK